MVQASPWISYPQLIISLDLDLNEEAVVGLVRESGWVSSVVRSVLAKKRPVPVCSDKNSYGPPSSTAILFPSALTMG